MHVLEEKLRPLVDFARRAYRLVAAWWALFNSSLVRLLSGHERGSRAHLWPIAFLLFLPIAVILPFLIPPRSTVDSAVLTSFYLNDFVIPHFPPGYPFATRLIGNLFHNIEALLSGATDAFYWSFLEPPLYSAAAQITIILVQHVALLGACAFVAASLFRSRTGQVAATAVIYFSPLNFYYAHSIYTEALATPATLAAFGFAMRALFFRDHKARNTVLVFAFATLAALARQPNVIIALFLPASLMFFALGKFAKNRTLETLKPIALAVGVTALMVPVTHFVASGIAHGVMYAYNVQPRSTYGRPFVHRIQYTAIPIHLPGMTSQRLEATLANLRTGAGDPDLAKAIDIVSRANDWVEAFNRISEEIVAPNCRDCTSAELWYRVDMVLNRVAKHAIASFDRYLLFDTFRRIIQFTGLENYFEDEGIRKLEPKGPDLYRSKKLCSNPYSRHPGLSDKLKRSDFPLLFDEFTNACAAVLWYQRTIAFPAALLIGIILIATGRIKEDKYKSVYCGLLLTNICYFSIVSTITVYLIRYAIVVDLFSLLTLLVLVSGWIQGRHHHRRTGGIDL